MDSLRARGFGEASHDDGVTTIFPDGITVAVFIFVGVFRWLPRCETQAPHQPFVELARAAETPTEVRLGNLEGLIPTTLCACARVGKMEVAALEVSHVSWDRVDDPWLS